jgi:3-hydroxyacyl-[acyl-carrier-protein] dehydratase
VRYVLIDRILAITPGGTLTALKNVSASDDLVSSYGRGRSALPASMVLESMAQGAGLLAVATTGVQVQPVLAKVQPFTSQGDAVPGDQIRIEAALQDVRPEGCRANVTASVGGRPLADATIYLGFVPLDDARTVMLRAALEDAFPGWFDLRRHAEASQ